MATLKKLFGDSKEHLKTAVTGMENRFLGMLAEGEYATFHAHTDEEKLQCLAKQCMIFSDSKFDANELAAKFQSKDWKKTFDTYKTLKYENQGSRVEVPMILKRIKSAVNDIPETEEEKAVFREAALQLCRDYTAFKELDKKDPKDLDQNEKDFLELSNDLKNEVAEEGLKQKEAQDLRESLTKEYSTLQKEKSGWFLSKTNSPEYNEMMRHLKLFNAKMDILEGHQPRRS